MPALTLHAGSGSMGRSTSQQIRGFFPDDASHATYERAHAALMAHITATDHLFRKLRLYERRLGESMAAYHRAKEDGLDTVLVFKAKAERSLTRLNSCQELIAKVKQVEADLSLVVERATPELMRAWQRRNLRQLRQFASIR